MLLPLVEKKRALVIGNSEYSQNPLGQGVEQAENVNDKLKTLGYRVNIEKNLKGCEMHERIDKFISKVKQNNTVIMYYSGHGIQCGDQNYLIGCDNTDIEINNKSITINEAEVILNKYTINVQEKLKKVAEKKPFIIIFFLDCCRNYWIPMKGPEILGGALMGNINDQIQTRQLSQSIIAFACGPGETVSGNGIFTKHLLQHIGPNIDIEKILRKVTAGVVKESNSKQFPNYVSFLIDDNIFI